jgi:hypothetical protein
MKSSALQQNRGYLMQNPSEPSSPGDSTQQLLNERGKTHGDFSVHASMTQALKDQMGKGFGWGKLTDYERESLEMIAHKIGRILAGNPHFKDHWDDIAGYAKLVADRCPS